MHAPPRAHPFFSQRVLATSTDGAVSVRLHGADLQTDVAMRRVLARRGPYACEWVLVTNGDNLYAKSLFFHACPRLLAGVGLTAFYFSSHYPYSHQYVQQGRVERSGQDVLFKTRLVKSWVDLGAIIVRAPLLRANARAAMFTDCRAWRTADGRYVQRLVTLNASSAVIDRILVSPEALEPQLSHALLKDVRSSLLRWRQFLHQ
jgi:hypothetical protein